MRGLLGLLFAIGICGTGTAEAQAGREFRGVWIATVANLDWPSSGLLSPEAQRAELAALLDELEQTGVNAVLFQVRPEADALYDSPFEPWSRWLTGHQGTPPEPLYDPLAFAIAEAHRRGMELHAWFNPFRAVQQTGAYPLDVQHVALRRPEWILNFNRIGLKLLDPGCPDVRDYVTSVVMDVVRRYDIDGVHFDDYFYPYPDGRRRFKGITLEDDATFAQHAEGFTDRRAWRRDNVNRFIAQVHDSIKAAKPWVKFGVSPFGVWRDGVPRGVTGLSAYQHLFADATAWLKKGHVDYLAPQLYWAFGSRRDYGRLAAWWAGRANGRHLYPGHAAYRAGTLAARRSPYGPGEVPSQIRYNRADRRIQGSILFRAQHLLGRTGSLSDSLRTSLYPYPALTPTMPWLDQTPPAPPREVSCRWQQEGVRVRWTAGLLEGQAPEARRYAVYRMQMAAPPHRLKPKAQHLVGITGLTSVLDQADENMAYGYMVTAVSANSVESRAAACLVPGDRAAPASLHRTARPTRFFPE